MEDEDDVDSGFSLPACCRITLHLSLAYTNQLEARVPTEADACL
jgi:hypothetical protein